MKRIGRRRRRMRSVRRKRKPGNRRPMMRIWNDYRIIHHIVPVMKIYYYSWNLYYLIYYLLYYILFKMNK